MFLSNLLLPEWLMALVLSMPSAVYLVRWRLSYFAHLPGGQRKNVAMMLAWLPFPLVYAVIWLFGYDFRPLLRISLILLAIATVAVNDSVLVLLFKRRKKL